LQEKREHLEKELCEEEEKTNAIREADWIVQYQLVKLKKRNIPTEVFMKRFSRLAKIEDEQQLQRTKPE